MSVAAQYQSVCRALQDLATVCDGPAFGWPEPAQLFDGELHSLLCDAVAAQPTPAADTDFPELGSADGAGAGAGAGAWGGAPEPCPELLRVLRTTAGAMQLFQDMRRRAVWPFKPDSLQAAFGAEQEFLDDSAVPGLGGPDDELVGEAADQFLAAPGGAVGEGENVATTRTVLPIAGHREEIVDGINGNTVCIVEGETGSGKSSQVPQYILDHCIGGRSSDGQLSILVTQPRRVAAISLAGRVAAERGEALGNTIGYRIGGARKGKNPRITFVTTGWLVQYLTHVPDASRRVTHIVLDEVHERDVDSDIMCLVCKLLLDVQRRRIQAALDYGEVPPPPLRLVLMSATLNSQLFADYFASVNVRLDPGTGLPFAGGATGALTAAIPRLHVGVMRYPLTTLYLEDLRHMVPDMRRTVEAAVKGMMGKQEGVVRRATSQGRQSVWGAPGTVPRPVAAASAFEQQQVHNSARRACPA